MKVKIQKSDAINCNEYADSDDCMLCTTLRRMGYKKLHANPFRVTVNDIVYNIVDFQGHVGNPDYPYDATPLGLAYKWKKHQSKEQNNPYKFIPFEIEVTNLPELENA